MTSRKSKPRKSKDPTESKFIFPELNKERFQTLSKAANGNSSSNLDDLKNEVEFILASLSESSCMLQHILNGTTLPIPLQVNLGLIKNPGSDQFIVSHDKEEPLKLIFSQRSQPNLPIVESKEKLKNEVETIPNEHYVIPNKFWDLMEPYCSDITVDNIKYLEGIIDSYQDDRKWTNLLNPPKLPSPSNSANASQNYDMKMTDSFDIKSETPRNTNSYPKYNTPSSLMNLAIRIDSDLKYDSNVYATSEEASDWIYSSNFIDSVGDIERDYLDLIKTILDNERNAYQNNIYSISQPASSQNGLNGKNGFHTSSQHSNHSSGNSEMGDLQPISIQAKPFDSLKVIAKSLGISSTSNKIVEKKISNLLDRINGNPADVNPKQLFKPSNNGLSRRDSKLSPSSDLNFIENGELLVTEQSTPTKLKRGRPPKSEPGSPQSNCLSSKLNNPSKSPRSPRSPLKFYSDNEMAENFDQKQSSRPDSPTSRLHSYDSQLNDINLEINTTNGDLNNQTNHNYKTCDSSIGEQPIMDSQCSGLYADPYANSDEVVWSLVQKQRELSKIRSLNLRVYKHLLACAKIDIQRQKIRRNLAIADADVLEAYEKIIDLKRQGKIILKKDKDHTWKCLRERSKIVSQLLTYETKNPLPKDLPFNLELCTTSQYNNPI